MTQFVEFIGNHWVLSALWLAALAAIVFYHQRTGSSSVGPQQAVMLINRRNAIVVDLREKKEFESGHIVGALNIPLVKLQQRIAELNKYKDKDRPLILVCKMGQQSGEAAKALEQAGHSEVYRLSGGVTEWKAQTLPLVQ
ncbi:MAG: rhodanese-like domain-containing protein [Pseudohongiellaceae bacterium]